MMLTTCEVKVRLLAAGGRPRLPAPALLGGSRVRGTGSGVTVEAAGGTSWSSVEVSPVSRGSSTCTCLLPLAPAPAPAPAPCLSCRKAGSGGGVGGDTGPLLALAQLSEIQWKLQ